MYTLELCLSCSGCVGVLYSEPGIHGPSDADAAGAARWGPVPRSVQKMMPMPTMPIASPTISWLKAKIPRLANDAGA
jgi:hypothetical protein